MKTRCVWVCGTYCTDATSCPHTILVTMTLLQGNIQASQSQSRRTCEAPGFQCSSAPGIECREGLRLCEELDRSGAVRNGTCVKAGTPCSCNTEKEISCPKLVDVYYVPYEDRDGGAIQIYRDTLCITKASGSQCPDTVDMRCLGLTSCPTACVRGECPT